MVAGESGLGKTTFINTLVSNSHWSVVDLVLNLQKFSTTIKNYADHKRRHAKQVDKTVEIEITKAELEEKFFKGMHTRSDSSFQHLMALQSVSQLLIPLASETMSTTVTHGCQLSSS